MSDGDSAMTTETTNATDVTTSEYRVMWQGQPCLTFATFEEAAGYIWLGVQHGNDETDYWIERRAVRVITRTTEWLATR